MKLKAGSEPLASKHCVAHVSRWCEPFAMRMIVPCTTRWLGIAVRPSARVLAGVLLDCWARRRRVCLRPIVSRGSRCRSLGVSCSASPGDGSGLQSGLLSVVVCEESE